jgi:hypothetical protein
VVGCSRDQCSVTQDNRDVTRRLRVMVARPGQDWTRGEFGYSALVSSRTFKHREVRDVYSVVGLAL